MRQMAVYGYKERYHFHVDGIFLSFFNFNWSSTVCLALTSCHWFTVAMLFLPPCRHSPLFHQKVHGASSVLVLMQVLNWCNSCAAKELVCFFIGQELSRSHAPHVGAAPDSAAADINGPENWILFQPTSVEPWTWRVLILSWNLAGKKGSGKKEGCKWQLCFDSDIF